MCVHQSIYKVQSVKYCNPAFYPCKGSSNPIDQMSRKYLMGGKPGIVNTIIRILCPTNSGKMGEVQLESSWKTWGNFVLGRCITKRHK